MAKTNAKKNYTAPDAGLKDWTVMIYMAGDNNLSADMSYALSDLRKAAARNQENVNLFVFFDASPDNAPSYYFDFTNPEQPVYQLVNSVDNPFGREKKVNRNSAAVYTLMNFINWCVNDTHLVDKKDKKSGIVTEKHSGKRAKKYALIISGHSSSFLNMTLMIDSKSRYYTSIRKFSWALRQITRSKKYHHGVKLLNQELDILGFDSCVMGLFELSYDFKQYAKTLIASEGNMPNAGWTYGSLLTTFANCDHKTLKDEKYIAKDFVEEFITNQNEFLIGGVNVDLSAWDLDKVNLVKGRLNNLSARLLEAVKNEETQEKIVHSISYAHLKSQSYLMGQTVDLRDFCLNLGNSLALTYGKEFISINQACLDVRKAIDACVLQCGFSGGKYQYSNGISVFFPWSLADYLKFCRDYHKLYINSKKVSFLWNDFLREYVGNVTLQKSRRMTGSQNTETLPPSPGRVIVDPPAFLAPDNPSIQYFRPNVENPYFFVEENNKTVPNTNWDINELNYRINPAIPRDRINPRIPRDRINPAIPRDRLLEELSIQIHNVQMVWNISGFTKEPHKHRLKK